MIYRRRKHSDCWHFVRTCRWWPPFTKMEDRNFFKQVERKPTSGEFCNECRAKAKRA